MNKWIRAGVSMLVVAGVVLVTGLLVPLSIEDEELGTIDCGSALSVDASFEAAGGESGCEEAANDRRTLVYLVAGAIGGIGLICIGLGQPQTPSKRNPHPFA